MRQHWWSGVGLGLLFVAGWCSAADEGDLFSRLDADQDGVITAAEVGDKKAQFERMLRSSDKNGDGKLSREEFTAGLKDPELKPAAPGGFGGGEGRPGGEGAKALFSRADKNGNGKIEKDEAPERLRENFARIDADGDGAIDEKEFARVIALQGGRPAEGDAKPDGSPGSPPERRPGPPGGPLLRVLDADGDGELSTSEIAGAVEAIKKLDKNGDGKITREELGPPPGEGRPEGRPGVFGGLSGLGGMNPQELMQRLKDADKNGDGKLSKEEAPERLRPLFDRADTNGDGQLEVDEMRGALQKLREAGGGRPPQGEPK